ncbi:MAG TPA: TIR domain-containing protein [Thermomicrobiales bacterium]|nr:TIR domain-containing protein [Thermomicrobiales bacterium]
METASDSSRPYVFLSYASADRERALAIARAFEHAGISVWIDKAGIAGGTSWAEEIVGAIRGSMLVAVLCTAPAMASRNVRQELQLAWEENRPILPLLLESIEFPDSISYFLRGRQWIDVANRPQAEWLAEITAAIQRADPVGSRVSGSTPLPEVPTFAAQLPAFATRMVGREREQRELFELLERNEPRLITLIGPGGVGKTRLALETMNALDERFPGGRFFVDLAPVTDANQVAAAIGRAFGLQEGPGESQAEILKGALANRQGFFLVLDNFEHVIEAAPLVGELIDASPDLRILVTSRESLRIRSEYEISVQPLELPERTTEIDFEAVAAAPAVALFLDTASTVRSGFALSEDNVATVAEICRRLDGLPLAIELAAARVRHFPPGVLLQNLTRRLPMLTGGRRDQPARQQTLARTISWSYDLLPPAEQRLFRLLSVFVGGASYDDIVAVVTATGDMGEELDLLGGLASLVEKSLLRTQDGSDGMPRFSMLETVSEFGANALHAAGETSRIEEAHARHFLATTESFRRGLVQPLGNTMFLPRVERDIDNYRTAIAWFVSNGDATNSAKLTCRLYGYFYIQGLYREVRELIRRTLELTEIDSIDDELKGLLLTYLGHSVTLTSDPAEGEQLIRQAIALVQHDTRNPVSIVPPLECLMIALRDRGMMEEALIYARQLFEQSVALGDTALESHLLYHRGYLHYLLDELDESAELLTGAIDLATASGADETALYSRRVLAMLLLRREAYAEAVPVLRVLQQQWTEAGYRGQAGLSLGAIVILAAQTAQLELAAQLSGFCVAYENQMGHLRLLADRLDEIRAEVRNALGTVEFDRLSETGARLTVNGAVALAETALDRAETGAANRSDSGQVER